MRADRLRGFILPTSLLVLTLLTVMLTAAFVLVSAEWRSTDNAMAGTRALALAQAGMQTYFATNRSLTPTNTTDSLRITYTGGYTDVVARKMILATSGVTTWVVKATGTTVDPLLVGQVTARRVIGRMALLYPAALPARAAMVALNGINANGATGNNPVDGGDNNGSIYSCTAPGWPGADTSALAVPRPGYYTAATASPLPAGEGVESLATRAALFDSTHIDWATILSGSFTPDYSQSGGTLWYPAPSSGTNWEVGYVTGNVTIPGYAGFPIGYAQQGVLIVTGNVTMANNAHWDGIIIAGGTLQGVTSTSQFLVHGMVVTGLNCYNVAGACSVPKNQLWRDDGPGSGNWHSVKWSWCWAHIGIATLAAMAPTKNTFIDNWAAY
jgi:Tfp pilus assembly protein PilX